MSGSEEQYGVIQENRVIPLWSLTVWLVVMNTTMFNVALPSVIAQFDLSPTAGSWIVSGYSIVFALSTITFSRLSDFIPIKQLLFTGLIILGIASITGYFANSFIFVLVSRLVQAMGAGAVPGLGMVLATRYIPISRRGKAMSLISSAASLGFGLGPVIGGGLTQLMGWNVLFIVTGLVLLLLPVYKKYLPLETRRPGSFDFAGALLTGGGVTCFLLYLSSFSFLLLGLSVLFFTGLIFYSKKKKDPFIRVDLFKNVKYVSILFIGLFAFMTHFAFLFVMPVMLSNLFHKEPAVIGFVIFPGAMLSALAAIFVGRWIDRFGNLPVMRMGLFSLLVSAVLFSLFATKAYYLTAVFYMFTSIGFSSLTSSLANENSRILDEDEVGSGMGMLQLIQFFGGALGVAVAGLLIQGQKGLELSVVFRNVFLFYVMLLCIAVTIYYLKIKKNSVKSI
ncbi:MFS transporter [Fictibacillus barbaricus]|uniref:DHA2 family metal-tetracycline-proton antiporter-like MFS transporter n=1 Tax=Fictibacillus barbaricus TaxID=182136 RepID=A0ABU1U378_9BACL|nr:MFS transporter [Fictibacillus barbaricus]MDR7073939.1 DHA2 family metal-tetracycline-proton antiporter-like MFS transporter [Fictibacillus barbaricus]